MGMRSMMAVVVFCTGTAFAGGDPVADREEMIELAWKRGCFNCHEIDKTIRGPAWVDVAERYRGDDEALERLVVKVRNGGVGNWGDDPMTANRRVPEEDIRTLVGWLLSLEKESDKEVAKDAEEPRKD